MCGGGATLPGLLGGAWAGSQTNTVGFTPPQLYVSRVLASPIFR